MRTHWKNKASGSWQWLRDSKWRIVALLVCVGYILGSQPRQAAAIVRKYQDVLWNKNTAGKLFNYFAAGTGLKATVQSGTDKDKTPKNKIVPPGPNIPLVTLQGGDTQATATPICSFPANLSGTTVGATDNYDLPPDTTAPTLTATCATTAIGAPSGRGSVYTGTGTGPDVVYKLEFPAGNPDTLTITMDPTGSQDLALIVYCNTVSSSLSDGLVIDDTGTGGVAESVTVSNIVAGTTLYIVVDGYSTGGTPPGPSGAYTLSITSSGSTQPNCGPVCAPFTCPTNINVNTDTGACTAVVNYAPPTGQDCTITCTPASGTTFPLGTTTVTCSNTGGTPSCTFLVSVADNSPPTVACPANITVNGSSPTVVNYTVPTAADNCGASVACVPNTGSSFPVGTTTVTCTATDGSQNMSSCNFTVSVVACTITCPADQVAWTAGTSAVVSYPAPTADASCGTVTCSPASGSTFNVGTTTVTCSTTAGPSCSFNVTVNQLTLGAALADPIACTGPGNKVNGSFSATNNSGASATVSVSATLSNIAYLPNTATATQSGSIIV
ncbi:MAG: HYR domain-containing protein, partial [Acidobacteriota bacterium]|nr:HYR domain-containing protein [Acidobacteriota bacterium]